MGQKYFKIKPEDFPDYKTTVQRISLYISECIRRAHKGNSPALLERVILTFKLLAYFHKLQEITHYWCESEFNEMVRFSIDPQKMDFKYLKKDEVKENFFDEATAVRG